MARVDMSKAKKKAQEEADRAAARASYSGSLIYWKPKQGKNKIRVLPPWTDDENSPNANQFWREVYVHFGVGENDTTINMVDASGVALASIQALNNKLEQRDAEIDALREELESLKEMIRYRT